MACLYFFWSKTTFFGDSAPTKGAGGAAATPGLVPWDCIGAKFGASTDLGWLRECLLLKARLKKFDWVIHLCAEFPTVKSGSMSIGIIEEMV